MGTKCEYCGSRDAACESFREYAHCDVALDQANKAENLYRDEAERRARADADAIDFELRYYPDDDELPQASVKTLGRPDDVINIPDHYAKWTIEPITFIMENELPFAEGNVIKYTMRHMDKNGLEDIKKAIKYLKFIAEKTYGAEL